MIGQRQQLMLLLVLDVGLLWVASSVLRGKGLIVFAAGLALLAWTAWARRRGNPRPLLLTSFALMLGAATVLGLEALLYLFPGMVTGRAANHTFGGYHGERDGIYRFEPHMGVVMRPSFRRTMHWNGHWWTHETNADGYRGERLTRASAVFLGDSMIYGHGVEVGDTVPARFAAASGRPTANLGQQGTCLVQAWLILRDKGAPLQPQSVFVSSHPTDIPDALHWYEPAELQRFLTEDDYAPLVRPHLRDAGWRRPFDFWLLHMTLPLRSGRLLQMALKPPRNALPGSAPPPGPFVPSAAMIDEPFTPEAGEETIQLGWKAHRRALSLLKRTCDRIGARLVVFDLGYPRGMSLAVEQTAREIGALYHPVGRLVLARAQAGEPMYLHGDGHWTREGAQIIGRELAASEGTAR